MVYIQRAGGEKSRRTYLFENLDCDGRRLGTDDSFYKLK